MTYESPITLLRTQTDNLIKEINEKTDEVIFKAVVNVLPQVNKEELIKALAYDREQYSKGYKDRDSELVRCEYCRHWSKDEDMILSCDDDKIYGWCDVPSENDDIFINGDYATRMFTSHDFFCKSGERREEVNGFKSVGQAWNTSQERRYP